MICGMKRRPILALDISPSDYGAVIPAMVAGSADIAYGVILQIEQAYGKGIPVRMVAPAAIDDARHPTNVFPLLQKYAKVDASIIAAMSRAVYAESLTPDIVQPSIDFGARYKLLDAAFPAKDILLPAT